MGDTTQKRSLRNHRTRLVKRGMMRFEVLGLDADRDLIRSLAKRRADDDPEAARIRAARQPHDRRRATQQGRHPRGLTTLAAGRSRSQSRPFARSRPQGRLVTRYLRSVNVSAPRNAYGRFFSPAAAAVGAGAGLGASAGALPLLPAPNNSRVGLRSRLFTARLISASVRRPSAIRAPERLSKSSASSGSISPSGTARRPPCRRPAC